MMRAEIALLPCPFCGEQPKVLRSSGEIVCSGHDCFGPVTTAGNLEDATVQWNKRARSPLGDPTEGMVEAVRLPIFADGGIGSRLLRAAEAYAKDEYIFSPDDGSDHEPTEFERMLFEDMINGLFAHEVFADILQDAARAALRTSGSGGPQPRPASEYDTDMGAVLWWKFPIAEPPYVGAPDDGGMTVEVDIRHYVGGDGEVKTTSARTDVGGWPGYHTHFTPIAIPATPPAILEEKKEGES